MLILVIDDEKLASLYLIDIIKEVSPGNEIISFSKDSEALHQIKEQNLKPDVAFLDINMPLMSGLELAITLKKIYNRINIIFVTGYSEYAFDAMKIHSSGYIMKPATYDDVKKELENLRHPVEVYGSSQLKVQCFGNFDVFINNEPVKFQYTKTKELFAYLIDRKGASCNTGELCSVLWPDEPDSPIIHQRLRRLVSDLHNSLINIGCDNVFIKFRNSFSINTENLECDYYGLLERNVQCINLYCGEYMTQYSWAEMTLANLPFVK